MQGADLVFGGWSSWSWHSDHIGQVTYCKQLPMLAALVILIIFWVLACITIFVHQKNYKHQFACQVVFIPVLLVLGLATLATCCCLLCCCCSTHQPEEEPLLSHPYQG